MMPHAIADFLFEHGGLEVPEAFRREYWEFNARHGEPWAVGVDPTAMPLGIYLHADAFLQTHTHFHTQTLLHTDAFAHRHRRFSTQTLLHTDAFTHKHFYTHTLLHTDAFTRKHFYIQALLHTDAFTLRHFYTQTLFHTDPFTHRRFYTQTLLHTDASTETFTQRRSQSAAPLGDLSCKQRCANIVAMEMLKNRKSAQDQAQYHDQRTIQCKASAL